MQVTTLYPHHLPVTYVVLVSVLLSSVLCDGVEVDLRATQRRDTGVDRCQLLAERNDLVVLAEVARNDLLVRRRVLRGALDNDWQVGKLSRLVLHLRVSVRF